MFLKTEKGKLEYLKYPANFNVSKPIILILSNAYGILKYTRELIAELSRNKKFNIFAFNLSGQGNSDRTASLENYVDDINNIFNFLINEYNASKQNFFLFINCSGIFPVLELAKRRELNFIKKIIIYNYLHTPSRLYYKAIKKMDNYNVRHEEFPIYRDYNVIQGFEYIKIPVVIIHPRIKANFLRAKDDEIEQIQENFSNIKYIRPNDGYDIVDYSQLALIKNVVKKDILPIIN